VVFAQLDVNAHDQGQVSPCSTTPFENNSQNAHDRKRPATASCSLYEAKLSAGGRFPGVRSEFRGQYTH